MKITFLTSGSIHSNFTHRALKLAIELRKIGHDVAIVGPCADKYNDFICEKVSQIEGVRVIQPFQFETRRLEINLIPYILSGIYKVLREKSDLIYIYKPTPISAIGLVSKLVYGTPVVLDMDDLGSEVMRIEGHPAYQRKLVDWSERLSAFFADRIVVASTYLKDMYRERFPKKLIHLMPNGVDKEWFAPVHASTQGKRIVFMGAMNRKNILEPLFDILPNLIKTHADLSLVIIGSGKFLQYFKDKSKELGFEGYVTFTGWLAIDEARTLLHAGDIGYNYMPNQLTVRAASNMKLSQYMARGIVPIVSDIGDLKASVAQGKAGYVCAPDNAKDLEQVLLTALTDKDRMKKSEAARQFAMDNFNWSHLAESFNAWLSEAENKPVSGTKKQNVKRIFVVATSIPGSFGGSQIRTYNLVKQLSSQDDNAVELFCISSKTASDTEKARHTLAAELGIKIHIAMQPHSSFFHTLEAVGFERVLPAMSEYSRSSLGNLLRSAAEESLPDVVQVEQLDAYYAIRSQIDWLKNSGVKIVLDAHNVEAEAFKGVLGIFSPLKRLAGMYILPHLRNLEIEAAQTSDSVLACSEGDADYFAPYNKNVFVVPNGVDCEEFQPTQKSDRPVLLFIGGMKYPPNEDGLRFYLKEIHPLVKESVPDVRLLVVGSTAKWLRAEGLEDPTVIPLGFIENIRPYLEEAVIGICPIRQGSGTRLKVLTYMASGLPVISTRKGSEGIAYTEGREVVLADQPKKFAQAIRDLLQDRSRCEEVAQRGRALAVQLYDWNIIGKNLLNAYSHDFA